MSDEIFIPTQGARAVAQSASSTAQLDAPVETERDEPPLELAPRRRRRGRRGGPPKPPKPRVRKLRLFLILSGLGFLAFISTVFGMMMAVASDLPLIENIAMYRHAANSFLYDDHWRPIGIFAPPDNAVIVSFSQISPYMRRAIVAVEDKRFWSEPGVDIRGIARAFLSDVTGGARQGASTIAQQFVKNALQEQSNRTVFEKLREAALAYHLSREWSKEKILSEYLNSIYYGNGAYGIESAARVYFGHQVGYDQTAAAGSTLTGTTTTAGTTTSPCGDSTPTLKLPTCASRLDLAQSALLAGLVAAPSSFDPVVDQSAAKARRDLVLQDMLAQHMITRAEYVQADNQPLPTGTQLQQAAEPTADPYFTAWLRPQILTAVSHGVPPNVANYRAYYGGLKIRTTLDLPMQTAAEQAISSEFPTGYNLPTASLVAIDNKTGEVRAMVGGQNYGQSAFNLATQARRQPGSAFKLFTLAVALQSGYAPSSLIDSAPQHIPDPVGHDIWNVHNFGNTYSGPITLAEATAISDNSVFAQVGVHVGTKRIRKMAQAMGIRTPVSTNLGMILGGLNVGVDPLDMAHAYETVATGGLKVFNRRLGSAHQGPTGIAQINCPATACGGSGKVLRDNKPTYKRVLPVNVAATIHNLLTGVVTIGTAKSAAIPGVWVAGKTGTTSNYGDAWFVGWTPQLTVAVWVGYPDRLVPMTTDFNGGPVEGGTYPAIIWHNFMTQALQILASEHAQHSSSSTTTSTTNTLTLPTTTAPSTGTTTTGNSGPGNGAAAPNGANSGTTGKGNGNATGNSGPAGNTGSGSSGGTSGGAGLGGGGGTTGNSGSPGQSSGTNQSPTSNSGSGGG